MGTAQTKASNKYKAKTYDRIEIIVPKGRKKEIADKAEIEGESVNGFIVKAIDERISRNKKEE